AIEADGAGLVGVVGGEALGRDRVDVLEPAEREGDDVAPRDRLAAAVDQGGLDVARDAAEVVVGHGVAVGGDPAQGAEQLVAVEGLDATVALGDLESRGPELLVGREAALADGADPA